MSGNWAAGEIKKADGQKVVLILEKPELKEELY